MGRANLAKNFVTPVTQEFSKNSDVSNIVNFLFQISFVIELESLKHITQ
jgi:hypothetical protein